jgi:hypothetical protein
VKSAVNVDATKNALVALLEGVRNAAWYSLAETLSEAEKSAKLAIEAKTKRRTGALLRDVDRFRTPSGLVGHLVFRAPYAQYINDGTRPHTIRARDGGYLRHPGTSPRPFIALAMASGQMALRDGLTRRVDELSRAFNR